MRAEMSPPMFWILASLASGRRHGYEIIRITADTSGGQVSLKVATLYAALERMQRDGFIVTDGEEVVSGRTRRYFRISETGTSRLEAEVARMESAARAGRASLSRSRPVMGTTMASPV